MKPAFHRASRRHFLMGAGGASLAIPLLPSLLPKDTQAQVVNSASRQRFFVHMTTWHGAYQDQMFGDLLQLAPTMTTNAGGIDVRGAALPANASGGRLRWSEALNASTSTLTPRMVALTNVINGLDFGRGLGHNRGGTLGNFGASPTIDQVLAKSAAFYPTAVPMPAIVRNPVSFSWSGSKSNVMPTTPSADSNLKLFDALFPGSGGAALSGPRPVALDRVREHARGVLDDPRCSADCRSRLTQYLDLVADVQTRLTVPAGTTSSARPTGDTATIEKSSGFFGAPESQVQCERLWNDVVVAAFAAGVSRVYVSGPENYTFGTESEHVWHNNTAHALSDAGRRAVYSAALQKQFEGAMLDLATKMDAVRGADGASLLDNALLANSHELGSGGEPGHHHNRCSPVVTIGSAGGFFRTGLSLDYRDLQSFPFSAGQGVHWYGGLLYNQFLGMVLRAMGVAPAEYAAGATGHYGYPSIAEVNPEHPQAMWNIAGMDLPWLKA